MTPATVLVVEDDEATLTLLEFRLRQEGFTPVCVGCGEDAVETARSVLPNLILLDVRLPGVDGIEVCRILRSDSKTAHIPIIMVSARDAETDVVSGLTVGADDYVTKPFSVSILMARIKNALRRAPQRAPDPSITVRELTVDVARHEVLLRGKPIHLTHSQFRILRLLMEPPGAVRTRQEILQNIHGDDVPDTVRTVDVQIASLRKRLGRYGRRVETVRGVGYRLRD